MKTFQDWHDLYLAIDVDGLADKFEHFRNMSMGAFGLDPAHYVSNPGLFKALLFPLAFLDALSSRHFCRIVSRFA